jgi:hypothetical protein
LSLEDDLIDAEFLDDGVKKPTNEEEWIQNEPIPGISAETKNYLTKAISILTVVSFLVFDIFGPSRFWIYDSFTMLSSVLWHLFFVPLASLVITAIVNVFPITNLPYKEQYLGVFFKTWIVVLILQICVILYLNIY